MQVTARLQQLLAGEISCLIVSAFTGAPSSHAKHISHFPFSLQSHARIIPPVLCLALMLLAWKMETLVYICSISMGPLVQLITASFPNGAFPLQAGMALDGSFRARSS